MLDRAVTLALTLGTEAARGASPTYIHGKSRPTWTRRDSLLVPDRVVRLPNPLDGWRSAPEKRSYCYDLDHSSMIVWG